MDASYRGRIARCNRVIQEIADSVSEAHELVSSDASDAPLKGRDIRRGDEVRPRLRQAQHANPVIEVDEPTPEPIAGETDDAQALTSKGVNRHRNHRLRRRGIRKWGSLSGGSEKTR